MHEEILVTKAMLPSMEEYVEEIKSIWDNHWLTNMGPKHNMLGEKLKEYLLVDHISLFSNGHMALELTLQAMQLTGEVITTPFTFASTTHAIVRNGLTPVFCDINEKDYTIDAEKIEELITPKTSAILAVHVYGNICNVEKINNLARKYNLKVIYDAAHAFGVTYNGQGVASFGDASMLSFHATKVFNTIEGGAVCYSDESLGNRLYQLKNFGIADAENVIGVGANAKMNEFQAAMGICNLRHLAAQIEKRKQIVKRYKECLAHCPGIILMEEQEGVVSNYAYMPVRVCEQAYGISRNQLVVKLQEQNIFPRKYFYPLTSQFACYNGKFDAMKTPVAKAVADSIMTLPLYGELPLENVDRICEIILDNCVNKNIE